jgi:hypothetical protein
MLEVINFHKQPALIFMEELTYIGSQQPAKN